MTLLVVVASFLLHFVQAKVGGPAHNGITVTVFWIGEEATAENDYIQNSDSAWDDNWKEHYGGVDDPNNRNGYYPADFIPTENPFYFALPYNDFDADRDRKSNARNVVYWGNEAPFDDYQEAESLCKNIWIRITKERNQTVTVVYAQWEDVGPNGETDSGYVFGSQLPANTFGAHAGLDVSPAVRDYLNISEVDSVNWQFVDSTEVPDGPWTQIITTWNASTALSASFFLLLTCFSFMFL